MKKWILCIFIIALCFTALSCASSVQVEDGSRVKLTYQRGVQRIQRNLDSEEAQQVIDILNGKRYFEMSWDTDTCDFDKSVSLTVDGTVYAIAKDSCSMLKNLSNDELILLTDAEHAVIVGLFDTYGGVLPCQEDSAG